MWIIYSLYFALQKGVSFYIIKKISKDFTPVTQCFISFLFTLPFSFLIILLLGIPHVKNEFYIFTFCSAVFDTFAFLLTFRAFKTEDISLLAPISSFVPVFSLFFGILFLNETPTLHKLFGILLVVIGTYLLNLSDKKRGILQPILSLFASRGLVYFLIANILWSITPIFQKNAINATAPLTPMYASFVGFVFITIIIGTIGVFRKEQLFKNVAKHFPILTFQGLSGGIAQFAAYSAFALAPVSYVLSLFNFSTLVTIGIGAVFLKEQKTKDRLIGGIVMVAGSLFIIF